MYSKIIALPSIYCNWHLTHYKFGLLCHESYRKYRRLSEYSRGSYSSCLMSSYLHRRRRYDKFYCNGCNSIFVIHQTRTMSCRSTLYFSLRELGILVSWLMSLQLSQIGCLGTLLQKYSIVDWYPYLLLLCFNIRHLLWILPIDWTMICNNWKGCNNQLIPRCWKRYNNQLISQTYLLIVWVLRRNINLKYYPISPLIQLMFW